ncbi:MAG TPA: hypothetical protein VFO84_00450 [Dehalococcoidia bacterium]|nr:hypothetical protein [Dehalococcoidia bacterium]
MINAIVVGVIVMALLLTVITYVLLQEVRAQRHWRGLVNKGDETAIRALVDDAMNVWRTGRPPKGVSVSVWGGVQSAEVVYADSRTMRLSTSAEAQYAGTGENRSEVSSPLDEGRKIFMKLAEMCLYDIPNIYFSKLQIDVYTTFRHESGSATQRCILTGLVDRKEVGQVDWERDTPEEFLKLVAANYKLDTQGRPQPIEPVPLVGSPA